MFARGSAKFLVPLLVITATIVTVAAVFPNVIGWAGAGVMLALFLFNLWFFRDPERSPGEGVVSPADGKVLAVVENDAETRLTIFMTPVSVHVNRAPMAGRIQAVEYHQGSHVPAFNKESDRNERCEIDLSTPAGPVRVRLIAGTVARRIHPYVDPGVEVKKGDRIGLIAFGSRCELVLPPKRYRMTVAPGAWVKAGATPVAQEVV